MGIVLLFNQHSTIDVGLFSLYYFSFFYLFAKLVCEMYCIPKNLNSLWVESITLFFVNSFGSLEMHLTVSTGILNRNLEKKRQLSNRVFVFQFCGFVDWWSSTRGLSQIWNFGNPATFWWHARTLVTYNVRIVPMTPQHLMLYKTQSLTFSTCLKSAIILTREMIAHVTLWLMTCSLPNEFNANLQNTNCGVLDTILVLVKMLKPFLSLSSCVPLCMHT
jgi:hypothetical protein